MATKVAKVLTAVVAMQRRRQGPRRQRLLDDRLALAGIVTVEREADADAARELHLALVGREDEYPYGLAGRVGALLRDEVGECGPADLIFKPRDQWHTF